MPRFAVYYIPQADDPFYRLGTSLVGYDVRTRTVVTLPADLQKELGQFDASWIELSQPYGFHLTISDAIDCSWDALPQAERELADLLACFDPRHPFELRQPSGNPPGIWGMPGRNSLVLFYEPNEYLRMLHTLIIARINPLGHGSGFLKRYLAHPERELPHQGQQIRLFYSPTVLDCWYPHFTLLNPYRGDEPVRVATLFSRLFASYTLLTIQTVCLLFQGDDEENWQIYREFRRPS